MTLDSATAATVQAAVNAVEQAAREAATAPDLAAMKVALNRVWFATHKAQEAINAADAQTRRAALAKLDMARTFA
jgi:hypothetical protein